jgi:hypothetical protein
VPRHPASKVDSPVFGIPSDRSLSMLHPINVRVSATTSEVAGLPTLQIHAIIRNRAYSNPICCEFAAAEEQESEVVT